ncbi:MAG: CYTH domain-containing protein [Oscillospiraceae bacterium]|nr:CYTH domain-containing protein [Oscillospiraceae bacterium]
MATEYEWKFQATAQQLAAIAAAFPETGVKISMETTYFDTPTGALSAEHYTLRRRLENGESVCVLKTPAGNARSEFEVRCEDISQAVAQFPAMGCPADFSRLVQEGIHPICGAKFIRIAKTVCLPEGTLELALDEGVLMGGGREIPLCEVEVELKSGDVRFCDLFARTLAARFGLTREEKSKFRRALALYRGE